MTSHDISTHLDPSRYKQSARGYVHRDVLYSVIGDGPHVCAICARPINWGQPSGSPHQLQVDHIDWDRHNNDPANLQPTCPTCNSRRTQAASDYGDMLDDSPPPAPVYRNRPRPTGT
jgi:5-methylcytosine-specific restriction endonuclease McrA